MGEIGFSMYDFTYNNSNTIKKKPEKFLLFVKHLLPRFLNSVPDSVCLNIFSSLKKLKKIKKKNLIILETGCGASTLALFLHCAIHGGRLFSWDTNQTKGSLVRSVINESIARVLKVDVNNIWTFIGSSSTNPFTGINILKELSLKADYCFLDSAHNTEHLLKELKQIDNVCSKNFFIALDDVYTNQANYNYPYINMVRNKIGLKKIKSKKSNISKTFFKEVTNFYKNKNYDFKVVQNEIRGKKILKDIYYDYYNSDFNFMKKIGLVKNPKERFATFNINKNKLSRKG